MQIVAIRFSTQRLQYTGKRGFQDGTDIVTDIAIYRLNRPNYFVLLYVLYPSPLICFQFFPEKSSLNILSMLFFVFVLHRNCFLYFHLYPYLHFYPITNFDTSLTIPITRSVDLDVYFMSDRQNEDNLSPINKLI